MRLILRGTWNPDVFVSYCCCNKSSQIQWLKTTQIFISYSIWRSDIQNQSHWANVRMSASLCSFLETLEENPFTCLCQLSEAPACLGSRPLPPSSKPARLGRARLTLLCLWFSLSCPPSSLTRTLWLYWPLLDDPGSSVSPYLGQLIKNLNSPLPYNLT